METIQLDTIRPAEYNPRHISDSSFEKLKASLKTLGVIKPVLVNRKNNVIIAGHQRTRAMKELGITECIAFVLDGVNQHDECRFNQYHNACEYEVSDKAPVLRITRKLHDGINIVKADEIQVVKVGELASLNRMLSELINKYGEFGMPISDTKGNIVISSAYALASRNVGRDIHVLVIQDNKIEIAKYYLSQNYGEFSYDGITRHTYMQSLAQMHRLDRGTKKVKHSVLYEKLVMPYITKNKSLRILDFGAGEYDYAVMLDNNGYNIRCVDPYHRKSGKITVTQNTRDFLRIVKDLETKGQYDVVICDSVLNSVDTMQSWYDVIYTCQALCKVGGMIFIAGRVMNDLITNGQRKKTASNRKKDIYFTDKNGFTANYRVGTWFFQKFDDKNAIDKIIDIAGEKIKYYIDGLAYKLQIKKTTEYPLDIVLPSLMREWDMQLPDGKRYGLQNEIKYAIEKIYNNKAYENTDN